MKTCATVAPAARIRVLAVSSFSGGVTKMNFVNPRFNAGMVGSVRAVHD
jgi:hypothetical protein